MEITEDDSLLDLSTISPKEKELLVAIGLTKVSQLRQSTPENLAEELSKANEKFEFLSTALAAEDIRKWLPENYFLSSQEIEFSQKPRKFSLEEEIHFAPLAHTVSLGTLQKSGIDIDQIPMVKEVSEGDHFICCTEENRPSSKTLNESIDQILGSQ